MSATRYLPKQGHPRTTFEHLMQHLYKCRVIYYVALVVTVSLLLQFLGVGK